MSTTPQPKIQISLYALIQKLINLMPASTSDEWKESDRIKAVINQKVDLLNNARTQADKKVLWDKLRRYLVRNCTKYQTNPI